MSTPEPTRNRSAGGHFWTMIITLALAVVLVPFLGPPLRTRIEQQWPEAFPTPMPAQAPPTNSGSDIQPLPQLVPLSNRTLMELATPSLVLVESSLAPMTFAPSGQPIPSNMMKIGFQVARGAGVVYASRDGTVFIVTNAHLVTRGRSIQVTPAGSDTPRPAHLVGISHCDDLAMLSIDDPTGLIPVASGRLLWGVQRPDLITFGSNASLQPGDDVIAIGFPQDGLPETALRTVPSMVVGQVSQSAGRWQQFPNVVRHTAPIVPGYSGGLLLNRFGELVGLTSFVTNQGQGLSYAIGIDHVQPVAEQLIQGNSLHWTGMSLETRRNQSGLLAVVVDAVQLGSPANNAGIQAGDTLTTLNGKPVATVGTVCTDLRQRQDGEQVTLTVQRAISGESTPQALTFMLTIGRP